MHIGIVAKVCHEANRALCESLGDFSQSSWEDAPEWQVKSTIEGIQFFQENPEAPDSSMHDKWMKDKLEDGWVYGEVKDPDKKTHPCLVEFFELSEEQQAKDTLFRFICEALL